MAEFEAGNLVQLKSGGPVMTVEKVVTDGWSGSRSSPLYECSWFRGATRNKESFEEAALVEADEDEGGSG